MSRPKKPSSDPHSDRIAAEVSRRLNHALAGIDLRSLCNVSKPKKPARQAAPPRKRSLPVEPGEVQQTLFEFKEGNLR